MKKFPIKFNSLLVLVLAVTVTASLQAGTWIVNDSPAVDFSNDTLINFDGEHAGNIPAGWTSASGKWLIKKDGNNNVLAQTAKNKGSAFNVAVLDGVKLKDLELSVEIRANSGNEDRGGGLVWRYINNNNYYIARFNPLEDNYRLYKVYNGRRIQLASAGASIPKGSWFKLRIVMNGSEITCYLNGKKLISKSDDTFVNAGKTGFWTKADAVSDFSGFSIK